MEDKAKKDYKIKDKKVRIKASACYYIAGICFMLAGTMYLIMGKNMPIGMMYVSLAFLYMVIGGNSRKTEENRDGNSEDEKGSCDGQNL